nr:class I SAM-dependent methyltransferase [Bacteroidota bacterium]
MFFKQIIKRILRRLNPGKKTTGFEPELTDPVYQRFLTSNPIAYKKAIDAAQQYVSKLEEGNYKWLFTKPYESSPGNKEYFRLMYDLLNILKAMNIPSGARILEVGSGPGWITEILLMLGFSVDALEPSEDMIKIAKERCSVYTHYNSEAKHKVNYHQSTIEEIEFEEERFDAVLFFDSLHHVVDEGIAINKSFRFLKPGGYLGVVEGAWHPSNTELERVLMAEMKKYGTLENPFTTEYIDHILTNSGFTDIQRYVGVNGFYSKTQLTQIINDLSGISMAGSNN